jgi:hypothetical protein
MVQMTCRHWGVVDVCAAVGYCGGLLAGAMTVVLGTISTDFRQPMHRHFNRGVHGDK